MNLIEVIKTIRSDISKLERKRNEELERILDCAGIENETVTCEECKGSGRVLKKDSQ